MLWKIKNFSFCYGTVILSVCSNSEQDFCCFSRVSPSQDKEMTKNERVDNVGPFFGAR